MKRLLATLLTGCLAFQMWMGAAMPVYGAALPEKVDVPEILADAAEQEEGVLKVEVRSSELFPFTGKVTVQVSQAGGAVEKEEEMDFAASGLQSTVSSFSLPAGDYTVTVKTLKFADYTQDVHVEAGWSNKILIYPAKMETGTQAVAGWLRPGDVTGDGQINEEDTNTLLAAIRQKDSNADVNGDGVTDLLDIQYAVQSLDEKQESSVEKLLMAIPAPEAVDGTISNLEDFLNNQGSLTLQAADTQQQISESNPVGLQFTLADEDVEPASIPQIEGMTIHAPTDMDEDGNIASQITQGEATVTYLENGEEKTLFLDLSTAVQAPESQTVRMTPVKSARVAPSVQMEADGSLVLNFGSQIAVKRVTIRITGTKKTEPLVNIAKVEFVNNMEERIPAPKLDIPTLDTPVAGDKSITVSWNPQSNVTGYEVYVSGPVKDQSGNATQLIRVSGTQYTITAINNGSLKNFENYTLKVRSVNGDWSSPWSNVQTIRLTPQKRPAKPDNVSAVGSYRAITVSWKDMEDADGYMVYYKKSSEDDTAYRPVVEGFTQQQSGEGKLNNTRYMIEGLEDEVEYMVYVISWNPLGWGPASEIHVATTDSTALPQLPKYKLLNTSNGEGVLTNHIVNATYGGHGGAKMVDSPLDSDKTKRTAFGTVDDSYASYWIKPNDFDDGISYPFNDRGVTITLDDDYKMDYITFAAANPPNLLQYARIDYWNSEDTAQKNVGATLMTMTDEHNHPYYIIRLSETITANKVWIRLGNTFVRVDIKIGEIHFHQYDSIADDIMGLYVDEMHTTLRPDVDSAVIENLQQRLDMVDEASGEKHPLYDELSIELDLARNVLADDPSPSYTVHNQITAAKDRHLGFSGLNAWQPLGRTLYEGETFVVYVWHNTRKIGQLADGLRLIGTQNHAEASNVSPWGANLKVGRNSFTVPRHGSMNVERGGQLYISYTGNNANDQYVIRVAGGNDIPTLDVYGKTGEERTNAIREYVEKLERHVASIEDEHNRRHTEETPSVAYAYDPQNCIINATDIMMREMMYSVPATQVWAGIANAADKVTKLDNALKAMEQTMTLFYQHKGLSDSAGTARGNNALPAQHLNIRYMRMFAGAFMYASGNHIGIEWGSTPLASAPNDWSGFGWGIAHEIGHNINQGTYAVAEVTNNYFAQLLTGKTRYTYENVYKKVTSGAVGRASNVFTQLALYWQLHLAFDNQLDDKHLYTDYEEMFNNLFFARMDTYSRNPAKAPQPGLTLNGGSDQNLMRLACAAANKNILPFFERWGMEPDDATRTYAALYGEEEQKALYYVNDEARNYRVNHLNQEEQETIRGKDVITEAALSSQSNRVTLRIKTNQNAALILGYEISRSMYANGRKQTEVIGFVPIDTANATEYVDTVSSINNRVMEYEVRAVDKYLNYSNVKSAGSEKIETNGILNKDVWTVETTMTSADDTIIAPDDDDPDNGTGAADKKVHSIDRVLDNKRDDAGSYHGTIKGSTTTITMDLHKMEQVTALRYQGSALQKVTVAVSTDGQAWTMVKADYTGLTGTEDQEQTIWFDAITQDGQICENWIGTYDARFVRLTIVQTGDVTIREIDICGPSGDNVEFLTAEGQQVIGVLRENYQYGKEEADVIPAGSLIFTGSYKGNPAYNLVVLYDMEGNVVGAKDGEVHAMQVIFAEDPKDGDLGEMSNGTWVYYVEPGFWDAKSLQAISGGVRAELYRVDNALTLEGERVVSDTKVIPVPADPNDLKDITLTGKIPD